MKFKLIYFTCNKNPTDLVVIGIGVPLFLAHIVFNLVGIGIERATNIRKERWMMRKDRLYMSSARSNHFLMRSARFKGSYMPAARFNNLGNLSKWRL